MRGVIHRDVEGERDGADLLLGLCDISIRLQRYLGLQRDLLASPKLFNNPLHHPCSSVVLDFLRILTLNKLSTWSSKPATSFVSNLL